MRIKNLFIIPTGEKVTEKALRRVLISSICSILLCMTCLVSTTWAWFTVSVENTRNEIWIAAPEVSVTIKDGLGADVAPDNGVYDLAANRDYTLTLKLIGEVGSGSDLKVDRPVYAIMTVLKEKDSQSYYVAINDTPFTLNGFELDMPAKLSFIVSWMKGNAGPLNTDTEVIGETVPETTAPETTVPETTVPETTVPETTVPETTVLETTVPETTVPEEPSPSTEASTEPSTEPSTEATTEPSTEPSVETTPESTTEATSETTLPAA